jgi:hypothetical protein
MNVRHLLTVLVVAAIGSGAASAQEEKQTALLGKPDDSGVWVWYSDWSMYYFYEEYRRDFIYVADNWDRFVTSQLICVPLGNTRARIDRQFDGYASVTVLEGDHSGCSGFVVDFDIHPDE